MSKQVPKKRGQRGRHPARRAARPSPPETRRAEVATVLWMLTMLATLSAEAVGGLLRLWTQLDSDLPDTLHIFPRLMWFMALITGLICLLLTPLVYRFRRVPPPSPITVLAITVSLVPLVIGCLAWTQ